MTIGEKITHLRIANKISQEQLAEKLGVSRQSVSKWEMDQSLPHIDKVLLICELFSVSADELLHTATHPEAVLPRMPARRAATNISALTASAARQTCR